MKNKPVKIVFGSNIFEYELSERLAAEQCILSQCKNLLDSPSAFQAIPEYIGVISNGSIKTIKTILVLTDLRFNSIIYGNYKKIKKIWNQKH